MYSWCKFCKYFKEGNNGTSQCTKRNILVGEHDWCEEFEWILDVYIPEYHLEEYSKNDE